MEFKNGNAERGRTIFSGIIDTHPKRLDLLSIYIDQEAKLGNTAAVDQLFERGLASKLSSSQFNEVNTVSCWRYPSLEKAKFLFKKWINLAKAEGDQDAVDKVKRRAAEYVGSQQA